MVTTLKELLAKPAEGETINVHTHSKSRLNQSDNNALVLDKIDTLLDKLMLYINKVDENRQAQTQLALNNMKSEMDLKLAGMGKEIFDLNAKVDAHVTEKGKLLEKIESLTKNIKTLETDLDNARYDADDIQVCVNKPFLVVNGFKPTNKSDEEAFAEFCNDKMSDINLTMNKNNIAKLVRIKHSRAFSNSDSNKPETMIVKFHDEKLRDILFRNKRKLAKSGTTFTELLPLRRKQLLNKCISELPTENRSIWTDGGKVLVAYDRGSNNITHIKCSNDIEQLKEKLFRTQPVSST